MERTINAALIGILMLVSILAAASSLAQTTIERQSFAAASGELIGAGIVAQTTIGEAVTGVSGGGDIVAGSGTTYWTETPALFPDILLSEIAAPAEPVPIGSQVSASAQLLVAPAGEVVLLWSWGDGTITVGEFESATDTVTGTHAYGAPGIYQVTLQATAGEASDTATFEFVVVYDPSAGFVTGGGWIDSPVGAYTPNPSLTGRATFGFVSRYRRGQSQPDGNTQFQFRGAGFSFQSTSYDWLVVAGARAQFKGKGKVNDAGEFGFMLTAIDGDRSGGGDTDRFRIKIWELDDETVVYDNQLGDGDDANPTTVIGGGSIVIHPGGNQGGPNAGMHAGPDKADLPSEYALHANYPNPFESRTTIRYDLPEAARVRLLVFDVTGREVARLVEADQEAGRHAVSLNAASLANGVYIYRLEAGSVVHTQRMLLTR